MLARLHCAFGDSERTVSAGPGRPRVASKISGWEGLKVAAIPAC
jgi:hypothetical protein